MHLETMEPAAVYCVKAQTFVKAIGRHSAFSQAECVKVQGKGGLFVPWGPAQVTAPLPAPRRMLGCLLGFFGSQSPVASLTCFLRLDGFLW